MERNFYVYLLTNKAETFYIGVTNDLRRRVWEHQQGTKEGFTKRYHLTKLLYYEIYPTARDAIAREKQLKGWRREKKIGLVNKINPRWRDLADDF